LVGTTGRQPVSDDPVPGSKRARRQRWTTDIEASTDESRALDTITQSLVTVESSSDPDPNVIGYWIVLAGMVPAPAWDETNRFILLGGLGLSLVTLLLYVVVFPAYGYSRTPVWGLAWYAVGTFLLAAVPLHLFARRRIVSPVVAVAGTYAVAVVSTWNRIASAHEAGAALHAGPTALSFLLLFWVVPVILVSLLGGGEYALKRLVHRYALPSGE